MDAFYQKRNPGSYRNRSEMFLEKDDVMHRRQRKTKPREFEVQDLVCLYHPTLKHGLSKKFAKSWSGPWQITKKFSELNYEIVDIKGKRQVVHVNRLKKAHNLELWKPNGRKESEKNAPKRVTRPRHEKKDPQAEFKIGPYQLVNPQSPEVRNEDEPQADHSPDLPALPQTPVETPIPDRIDADYFPSDSPISRRELQTSRTQPPLTRLRAKTQSQHNGIPEVRQ
jgi:hypothetical protein